MPATSAPRKNTSKIRTSARLATELRKLQRRGLKVVFTNGCFDILHKGHVSYLDRARRLGDVLVVAINSDASVSRLKGPDRPINGLRDRMEVMAALECVDFVVSFGEDTPLKTIVKLRPDVLVKGGDWKPAQIVGAHEVLSWGGKVRSLKFVDGRSTTRIIEKARQ